MAKKRARDRGARRARAGRMAADKWLLADAIAHPGVFGPADHAATLQYGRQTAHDAPELLLDPNRVRQYGQELLSASMRLSEPLMQAATGLAVPPEPRPIDLFISHAKRDEEAVADFRRRLDEIETVSSYIDWIDDPGLDRAKADGDTAESLRNKMRESKAMLLLLSAESAQSFWVQWELGFFDALRGRVFIVPLNDEAKSAIEEQEYYELYPMLETPEAVIESLRSIARD